MPGTSIIAAGSVSPKVLFAGQNADTTEDAIYVAPAGASAKIATFSVSNASSVVGSLSAQITSGGGAITSLPVNALPAAIPQGATVIVGNTGNTQTWTVGTGGAAKGATSIPVASQTPNTTYAAGATVRYPGQPVYVSVGVYKSGQTASPNNHVVHNLLISGGDTYTIDEIIEGWLGPQDFVTVQASVANTINTVVTGIENT